MCIGSWLLLLVMPALGQKTVTGASGEVFNVCVVASGLSDPWEITYGSDGHLWVTEARGYQVSRINPATGEKKILLDLSDRRNFPRYDLLSEEESGGKSWPQSGLMGMALHPNLLTGKPYVYLAYLYHFDGAGASGDGCLPGLKGCYFRTRIERYTYDSSSQQLSDGISICDTIPGSNDHNSGRLLIAPVAEKLYLFYTVGDMGAGQFANSGRTNHAQSKDSYEGKILRFNTEPDADSGFYDKWIPDDNPFCGSRQNAVWTYGHRNAQGLCYAQIGDTGRIYSSEHGPFSDDEVNIIEKGCNYGHPLVIGYNDNNYNQLAAGVTKDSTLPGRWHTSYPLIEDENRNAAKIGADIYRNPLISLYAVSNDSLTRLFTGIQSEDTSRPDWPSEAPAGISVYSSTAIPGWQHSLLLPTLKGGKLIRLSLNEKGNAVAGKPLMYFQAAARYRDIAVSDDGLTIYVATDSSTVSSGPTRKSKTILEQRGTILAFTYAGTQKPKDTPGTPAKPPVRQRETKQKPDVIKAGRSRDGSPGR